MNDSDDQGIIEPGNRQVPRRRLLKELHNGAKIIFRRSWINEIPLLLLLLKMSIICLWATVEIPSSIVNLSVSFGDRDFGIEVALFMLIPALILAIFAHRMIDDRYVITEDQVVAVNGLLSLRVVTNRIHLAHVRGIEVERNLFQRIVNTGSLRIGTASHADQEVLIKGIYKPAYYRNIVESLMKENVEAMRSGDE